MPVRTKGSNRIAAPVIGKMIRAAKNAANRAYNPYSKFAVGAAILGSDGQVYSGCNVENASYGLTNCAERTAVFKMVSEWASKRRIGILAVVVYTPTDKATSPCGACRQVLNEFGPSARVICVCRSKHRIDTTLDQLLPDAFGPKNLA